MSKTTENLELFEYDTQTDGKQKFNITKALNNNFDKIDTATGKLSELVTEDKSSVTKAINEIADRIINKSNVDLSNLSAIGQGIIDQKASIDLSNLSAVGQAILDRKVEVEALLEQNGYAKFTWKENNKVASLIIQWATSPTAGLAGGVAWSKVLSYPVSPRSTFSAVSSTSNVACISRVTAETTGLNVALRNTTSSTTQAFVSVVLVSN